ncbi:hypothetical protein AVEN_251938-1 [Araneus ventricosus]|uniref:Uncharacterized protein n=1 Tax=Araneus ventricosus TaxID=182803 RepID=A0A4Y2H0Q5_ARAVE|nr:hypothetical protein AVEN_251938-1 [Araneus ventricosus]
MLRSVAQLSKHCASNPTLRVRSSLNLILTKENMSELFDAKTETVICSSDNDANQRGPALQTSLGFYIIDKKYTQNKGIYTRRITRGDDSCRNDAINLLTMPLNISNKKHCRLIHRPCGLECSVDGAAGINASNSESRVSSGLSKKYGTTS